jgi:hypothetical protein
MYGFQFKQNFIQKIIAQKNFTRVKKSEGFADTAIDRDMEVLS